MKDKINSFLDDVCLYIRTKSVHSAIRRELAAHIDELAEGFIEEGMSREEAEERAVLSMGSAEEIGHSLDKQHRPKTEWFLVVVTAALAVLGILINRSYVPFEKQLLIGVLGATVLVGSALADYTKLKRLSPALFAGLCGVFLLTSVLGDTMRSAVIFRVAGFSVMVVFFTQLLFPLFAGLMVKIRTDGGVRDAVKLTALMAAVILMPAVLGRNSYFLVYVLALGIIFIAAAFNGYFKSKKLLMIPVIAAFAAFGAYVLLGGGVYRIRTSLEVFFTGGQSDPTGAGYVTANIAKVLGASKPIGAMEGGLPEVIGAVRSNFILTEIIGRFGWLAGFAIIAVVLALLIRLFIMAMKIKGEYGRCLSLCCCALLFAKFAVSILMNLNLLPYMGVTLPLIGMGGADYLVTMFLIGLVISVYRRNNLFPEAELNTMP